MAKYVQSSKGYYYRVTKDGKKIRVSKKEGGESHRLPPRSSLEVQLGNFNKNIKIIYSKNEDGTDLYELCCKNCKEKSVPFHILQPVNIKCTKHKAFCFLKRLLNSSTLTQ